jgi:hypothetical protein
MAAAMAAQGVQGMGQQVAGQQQPGAMPAGELLHWLRACFQAYMICHFI